MIATTGSRSPESLIFHFAGVKRINVVDNRSTNGRFGESESQPLGEPRFGSFSLMPAVPQFFSTALGVDSCGLVSIIFLAKHEAVASKPNYG